jgi:predicted membrane protein (TIGR00267 family)
MGLSALVRKLIPVEPQELLRRYFINTLFDSTFVVLGVLAASAFIADANPDIALGTLFAACLAIGISSAVSVYEAEHVELEIRMQEIEKATLSSVEGTVVERKARTSAYAVAITNFLAPVFVAVIMGTPLLLYEAELISDFGVAATLSSILGIGIIFGAGYYLGTLGRGRPWLRAVRMSVIAVLAFGALVLFERLL